MDEPIRLEKLARPAVSGPPGVQSFQQLLERRVVAVGDRAFHAREILSNGTADLLRLVVRRVHDRNHLGAADRGELEARDVGPLDAGLLHERAHLEAFLIQAQVHRVRREHHDEPDRDAETEEDHARPADERMFGSKEVTDCDEGCGAEQEQHGLRSACVEGQFVGRNTRLNNACSGQQKSRFLVLLFWAFELKATCLIANLRRQGPKPT